MNEHGYVRTSCSDGFMAPDIKEKWGKIRSIGGMSPSPEKDAATRKWFEEGEFKDWLVKLEKSLPEQVVSKMQN